MGTNAYIASEKESDGIDSLEKVRHSMAHVLAMAVTELYPDAKLGIGPATDYGFYYDFDIPKKLTESDLEAIETRMYEIKSKEIPFVQEWFDKDEAIDMLNIQAQLYKVELISELSDSEVSFYKTGDTFKDLCRGPHVEHTGLIGEFKLTGVSGAYWKGDESRPQLQRISGVGFMTKDEIQKYFEVLDEVKMSDHRKLGEELMLFKSTGIISGFPIILPKGEFILNKIERDLYETMIGFGYLPVRTPIIDLDTYASIDNPKKYKLMSPDEEKLGIRMATYSNLLDIVELAVKTGDDFPSRLFELGNVLRYEKSGELIGLSRNRLFKMLGSSCISRIDDFGTELRNYINLIKSIYATYKIENYYIRLNYTDRPYEEKEKANKYDKVIGILTETFEALKVKYIESPYENNDIKQIKFEFIITDSYGRDSILTNGLIDTENAKLSVKYANDNLVLMTSAVIGSTERLLALLIEETSGNLPMWLSALQVVVIPIAMRFNLYADEVRDIIINEGFRAVSDDRDEKMQSKVRDAQLQKVPYMVIIGEKEEQMKTASLRNRKGIDLGMMSYSELIEKLKKDLNDKL